MAPDHDFSMPPPTGGAVTTTIWAGALTAPHGAAKPPPRWKRSAFRDEPYGPQRLLCAGAGRTGRGGRRRAVFAALDRGWWPRPPLDRRRAGRLGNCRHTSRVPRRCRRISTMRYGAAEAAHRQAILAAIDRPVDLVHCTGSISQSTCRAPATGAGDAAPAARLVPTRRARRPARIPGCNCVSALAARAFPTSPLLDRSPMASPSIALGARTARRNFALVLGRVCPEKGNHSALDAATLAGVPALVAARSFPIRRIEAISIADAPRLGRNARFLGPIGFARKRRLLTAARCLLVPSLVPETSSLVAMEALACGTPGRGVSGRRAARNRRTRGDRVPRRRRKGNGSSGRPRGSHRPRALRRHRPPPFFARCNGAALFRDLRQLARRPHEAVGHHHGTDRTDRQPRGTDGARGGGDCGGGRRTPFQSPAWLAAWWRQFGNERPRCVMLRGADAPCSECCRSIGWMDDCCRSVPVPPTSPTRCSPPRRRPTPPLPCSARRCATPIAAS